MTSNNELIDEIQTGYPIRFYSQNVPTVQDKIVSWKTYHDGMVRVSLGSEDEQHSHSDCLVFIQRHLKFFYHQKDSSLAISIPHNAVTVSFAVSPFKAGVSAELFHLKDRETPENWHFEFQMLSRNVQATYYVEDGQQYIAGLCYFLQPRDVTDVSVKYDEQVMHEAIWRWKAFPTANRYLSTYFKMSQIYGRYCKTAGKQVAVKLIEGKVAAHRSFNFRTWKIEFTGCKECNDELKTYEFPVPVLEKAAEVETTKKTSDVEPELRKSKDEKKKKMEEEKEEKKSVVVPILVSKKTSDVEDVAQIVKAMKLQEPEDQEKKNDEEEKEDENTTKDPILVPKVLLEALDLTEEQYWLERKKHNEQTMLMNELIAKNRVICRQETSINGVLKIEESSDSDADADSDADSDAESTATAIENSSDDEDEQLDTSEDDYSIVESDSN